MNLGELLSIVKEVTGDTECPKAKEHCYRLATFVMERQREIDATIADGISQETAEAIRKS